MSTRWRRSFRGEVLFEGYACDYHKATFRSYSYIALLMVGRYQPADEGVAVILRDRVAAVGIAPFTPHDMRRTSISERA
jgi:hypothetical protein